MTDAETKARKSRNNIIAFAIIGFMGLVFLITVVRIKAGTEARMDAEQAEALKSETAGEPLPEALADE